MSPAAEGLDGWFPVLIRADRPEPTVEWAYLGETRFTDPFFEQTVGLCLHHPFNQAFRRTTPVAALLERAEARPGLPPSGFIFHVSRCGSTLLTRMLGALPRVVALSEPTPVDAVLSAPGLDDDTRIAWLRATLSALGQRWGGVESHLVVKLDCLHAAALPLIQRAYPGVPWCFLVRDPVEVIVSQIRQRAVYTVPGMTGFGPTDPETVAYFATHPEEYVARILGWVCRCAAEALREGSGVAVNYRELPEAATNVIAEAFGLNLTDAERGVMLEAAKFNAKYPGQSFADDTASKRREASPEAVEAADRWVRPAYDEIECLRIARGVDSPVP